MGKSNKRAKAVLIEIYGEQEIWKDIKGYERFVSSK